MSNSPQMSLEERLVQKLKDETFMSLIGDEDAITELVKRALKEALCQPIRVERQYGGYDLRDSIVVTAARAVANDLVRKHMETVLTDLSKDEGFNKMLHEAIAAALPYAITNRLTDLITQATQQEQSRTISVVQEAIKRGYITSQNGQPI